MNKQSLIKETAKREIESTDKGIDKLGYELYGLSEEESRIVTPIPSFPHSKTTKGGRGMKRMVKTIIQIHITVVPPPLSHLVFDNGGGVPLFGTEGVSS